MNAQKYIDGNPVIRTVANKEETVWINPYFLPFAMTDATCQLVVSDADIEDAEKRLGTGSDTGEPPIRPQRELGFLCACDNGSQGHMQGREVLPRQRGPACAPREAAQPERLHPRAHAPRHVRVASGTSPSQLRADAAIVRVQ